MTTQELQDFAKEIGATINLWPVELTIKTSDCSVSVHVGMDSRITRRKIARLLTDKIESVFSPSEDLLILKERLEQVQ
jgi:hypothetical protein